MLPFMLRGEAGCLCCGRGARYDAAVAAAFFFAAIRHAAMPFIVLFFFFFFLIFHAISADTAIVAD